MPRQPQGEARAPLVSAPSAPSLLTTDNHVRVYRQRGHCCRLVMPQPTQVGGWNATLPKGNDSATSRSGREQLHQPIEILLPLVERLDEHPLVAPVDADVVDVAEHPG